MIRRLAALILLSTLSLIQAAEVPQQISVTVLEVGDNVTLMCPFVGNEAGLFYWYKLKFGYMVQTVAAGTLTKITLKEQFKSSRFTITKVKSQHVLHINNVSKEDEATYLCQAGSAYEMEFINGTILAVNDHQNQQSSYYVKQSPGTESVQPGEAATLQCSLLSKKENTDQCPAEHSVYWFRSGSGESHPGIIYTHRDQQEEPSCHYSLSKTIQNSSDTGTYYCAVVTCGQILLGGGTTVVTGSKLDPVVLVLGVLLACCVTVIIVLFYMSRRRVCEHCKAGPTSGAHDPGYDKTTVDQPTDLGGDDEAVNYAALEFSKRNVRKKRELPTECVYSAVRADHHTQHHPSYVQ